MASTTLIKRRITASKSIAQITKAMQMVAASKMKKAQNKAISGKDYAQKIQIVLSSLLDSSQKFNHPFLKNNKANKKQALLIISTNKGLCGPLNTNHFKLISNWLEQNRLENIVFVTVGRKGRDFVLKHQGQLEADFSDLPANFTYQDTLGISHFLTKLFLEKKVNQVFLSYSDFISTLSQKANLVQLLPITPQAINQSLGKLENTETVSGKKFFAKQYLIEPSTKSVINWLLPYFIELEVYHFLLESTASEQSARMVAMKNANENANELVDQLQLEYNKARQQQITSEISDIVTAWKSLQ